jgi:hypothetical protein
LELEVLLLAQQDFRLTAKRIVDSDRLKEALAVPELKSERHGQA